MKKFILTILSFLILSTAYSDICFRLHERHGGYTPCFDKVMVANNLKDPGYGYYEDLEGVFFTEDTQDRLYARFCTETYLGGVCFSSMKDNNFDTYKDSIKSFEILQRTVNGFVCFSQHDYGEGTNICYEEGKYGKNNDPNFPGNFNDQLSYGSFENVDTNKYPWLLLYDDRNQSGEGLFFFDTSDGGRILNGEDRAASFKWCTSSDQSACSRQTLRH